MCYTRLNGNARRKKSPKNRRLGTIAQLLSDYIFATKARIDNRKKIVKQQYLLHMPHNMVNFSLLAAEIVSLVWGTPDNFNVFSRFGFFTAATSLNGSQPNCAQCLALIWACRLFYAL